MSETPNLKNVRYVTAGTYVVQGQDDVINCDTTAGIVTLILPNILNSGFDLNYKNLFINDIGGVSETNNIIIQATGDSINNSASVLIKENGGSTKLSASGQSSWIGLFSFDVGGGGSG